MLVAAPVLLRQVKKPSPWIGRWFLRAMNYSHGGVTDWGLRQLEMKPDATVLDIGCGGGRTIQKLAAAAPRGRVHGVDYSAESVRVSRITNASLVDAGRVNVQQASVSKLPFPDAMFDLVTAVETHYYWPDLTADLREIRRVMKPHSTLAIIAECYKGGRFGTAQGMVMKILGSTVLTARQHSDVLTSAGFSEVEIVEDRKRGWMCALAKALVLAGIIWAGAANAVAQDLPRSGFFGVRVADAGDGGRGLGSN
jgi:SAM-dependent methyltransferase